MKEVQKMKQYYITELHMGDDGLESYTDHSGPFTLNKARKIMDIRRWHNGKIYKRL